MSTRLMHNISTMEHRGLSQPFYQQELWRTLGYGSLEDFLVGFWEGFFLKRDPNNMLCMLWTWQNADISNNPVFEGDFKKALGAITAKALVMPGAMDLYFPPEDNQKEVEHMKKGGGAGLDGVDRVTYTPVPGVWGHFAGGGANPEDTLFIDNQIKILLNIPL